MADASASGFKCMISLLDSELAKLDERSFDVTLEEVAKIQQIDAVLVGEVEITAASGN